MSGPRRPKLDKVAAENKDVKAQNETVKNQNVRLATEDKGIKEEYEKSESENVKLHADFTRVNDELMLGRQKVGRLVTSSRCWSVRIPYSRMTRRMSKASFRSFKWIKEPWRVMSRDSKNAMRCWKVRSGDWRPKSRLPKPIEPNPATNLPDSQNPTDCQAINLPSFKKD